MPDADDEDTAIGDAVDEVTVSPTVSRRFARYYVVALFGLIAVGLAASWYVGILSPTANPDLTEPAEWLIKGLALLFLFFTGAMVVRAVGLGFVKGVVKAVARIAHNYELPGQRNDEE